VGHTDARKCIYLPAGLHSLNSWQSVFLGIQQDLWLKHSRLGAISKDKGPKKVNGAIGVKIWRGQKHQPIIYLASLGYYYIANNQLLVFLQIYQLHNTIAWSTYNQHEITLLPYDSAPLPSNPMESRKQEVSIIFIDYFMQTCILLKDISDKFWLGNRTVESSIEMVIFSTDRLSRSLCYKNDKILNVFHWIPQYDGFQWVLVLNWFNDLYDSVVELLASVDDHLAESVKLKLLKMISLIAEIFNVI